MADDPELTVTYSVDPPGMTKDGMRLPQVTPPDDPRRGAAGARHGRRLRAAAPLPRRRDAPRATRPRARWRATLYRGDGDRALRGGGRARHARHRRQHRREDRRRGRPQGLCRDHRAGRCAACPGGGLSGAPSRHRARPAAGRGQRAWTSGAASSRSRPAARSTTSTTCWTISGLRAACAQGDRAISATATSSATTPTRTTTTTSERRGRGRSRRARQRRRRRRGPVRGQRGQRPSDSQDDQQDDPPGAGRDGRHGRHGAGRRGRAARGRGPAEPPPPAAAFRRRSRLQGLYHRFRRGNRAPRTWPTRPNSNGCAPISTSSWNR